MPVGATEKALTKHAQSLLLDGGVAVVPLTQKFAATLDTASKAFQGQLQCWASKPPAAEYTGFQRFPNKLRAEFSLKLSNLTRIGVLQPMAEEVVKAYDELGRCFLRQLALKLMAPCTLFDPLLQAVPSAAVASSLEAIQYLRASEQLSPGAPGCEAHADKGVLTLIFADSQQGLQVQVNGQWRTVIIPAGHVAVLPGYTLERATCGIIKAITHRVVMLPDRSRSALVYKLRASDNAVLNLYTDLQRHHTDIPLRLQGPIAVSELMYFFEVTHASVNDPARAERLESVHFNRPPKRVKVEQENVRPAVAPMSQPPTQPKQQQQAQPPIKVVVRAQDGSNVPFTVFPSTLMQKIFTAYAQKKSLALMDVVFMYSGEKLNGCRTLQSYEMENGDIIDSVIHMCGD